MPIAYSDPTYAALTVETANRVGQQKTIEKEADRRQQMDIAAMEIKSRRELVQFEADMRLQAAKLGQAWELEKMQRESELDFQFEQQKLTLDRSAMVQKQAFAKEQYLAYVDMIDSDHTRSPAEKAKFRQMATDKLIGGLQVAEEVYFPKASTNTAFGDFLNPPQGTTPAGSGPTASQTTYPSPGSDADWVKQARLGLPNATVEQLADKADELKALDKYEAEISQSSGFTMTEAQVKAKARERYIDDKVKENYAKDKAAQRPTMSVSQSEGEVGGYRQLQLPKDWATTKVMTPEVSQARANQAREDVSEGAVRDIIGEWLQVSNTKRTSATKARKTEQAARRKNFTDIMQRR